MARKSLLGRQHRRWLSAALGWLTAAYAGGLLLFLAWQWWLPREIAPLTLAAAFLPLLFAPLLLTLPLAWATHTRASLALHGVALGLFLVLYGPRLLPPALRVRPVQRDELAVTVMTYNLHYMYHAPEELAAAILAHDADLVALEEVAPSAQQTLVKALSPRYPYSAIAAWNSDVALFSRYPITAYEWRTLVNKPGGALLAEVAVDGATWRVIAVHPYSPRRTRAFGVPLGVSYRDLDADLTALLGESLAANTPTVLLGDLNVSEQSLAYRAARAHLHDAFLEAGWGLGCTFPQSGVYTDRGIPWPLVRIDYVLHSDAVRATGAQVVCNGVSDHCALLAELAIPR